MQDYYEQHVFGVNSTVSLSFVGSIANFVLNFLSIFVQILLSLIGARAGLIVAAILCTVGLELASLSTKIWQLYLTQGVLFGAGASIIFYVGMSCVSQWFVKRRGIALGIASSGSCIGGLVMPFVMTPLNRMLGVGWCYRILGFVSLVLCLIASALIKEKPRTDTKQQSDKRKRMRDILQLDVMKDTNFQLWCFADILIEMGYYVPYFFLPSYATYLGLPDSQGSSLISAASATNSIGRIISGHMADRLGHMNTIIVTSLFGGLSSLLIWTFAYDFGTLMAFASAFGFFGGAFVALGPSTTVVITGMEKFESGYSLFLLITVFSMFGPNVAGAIEAIVPSTAFFSYKVFTGAAYLSGTAVMLYLKARMAKGNVILAKL